MTANGSSIKMASGRRKHRSNDADEILSRLLAKGLRHEVQSLGVPVRSDGFIFVNELLQSQKFHGYSESDIRRVADLYEKKRFILQTDILTQKLKIKANETRTVNASLVVCPETTKQDDNETLSRLLAKVLRHDGRSLGLHIQSDGFIFVNELLQSSKFSAYSEADIVRVVDLYGNKRFTLETDQQTRKLKIKANQAHSFEVPDLDLQAIKNASEIPILIHLTTEAAWRSIQVEGLRRMNRTHIHFSPGEENIVRSKIPSCKVRIYLDTASAMAGRIKFFRSENNVILSPGNADGAIPPRFFSRVELNEGGRSRNCAHVATEEHFDVIYAEFQENDLRAVYHSCGYLFIT